MCHGIAYIYPGCTHAKSGDEPCYKDWYRLISVCKAGFERETGCLANEYKQTQRSNHSWGRLCTMCMETGRRLLNERYEDEQDELQDHLDEFKKAHEKAKKTDEKGGDKLLEEKSDLKEKMRRSRQREAEVEEQVQAAKNEQWEATVMEKGDLLESTTEKIRQLEPQLDKLNRAFGAMERRCEKIGKKREQYQLARLDLKDTVEEVEFLVNSSKANQERDLKEFEEDPEAFYDPLMDLLVRKFERIVWKE